MAPSWAKPQPRSKKNLEPRFRVSVGNNPATLVDEEDREGDQPKDEEAIPFSVQGKEQERAEEEVQEEAKMTKTRRKQTTKRK